MSAITPNVKSDKSLGDAARAYLAADAAHKRAANGLLIAADALADAEDVLLSAFERHSVDDVTGVFAAGHVLSIPEDYWEKPRGQRVLMIKAAAV